MSYEELVKKVWKMQKQYLVHKYEVFNDMHHWPVILSTTSEMGPIYHMDFSENISQMHKFEPHHLTLIKLSTLSIAQLDMELMEISICTTCLMKSDMIMLLQLQFLNT